MPKTAYNCHAVLTTAYRLHAVLMKAYSWHAVLMTAFDSISHACSSIKSIQSTQSEQLTRTSQCLFLDTLYTLLKISIYFFCRENSLFHMKSPNSWAYHCQMQVWMLVIKVRNYSNFNCISVSVTDVLLVDIDLSPVDDVF